ncbi:hypothetical protein LCGC14_0477460 [marine sediment metagenome]|uniref:Uncharacterized protein n=1 Tax=marine sediment metagenome TaxID=412755 RepID=A0A0F9SAA1_9ZZZZ
MNKRGQMVGFALLTAVFVFILIAFVTIEPLKENLDNARDSTALNCRGTVNFNQTAFDNDEGNTIAKLTRRPTCFVSGLTMVWFIGTYLIFVVMWLAKNWTKKRRIRT